ncbi:MAG: ABC transporter substrate-binding protein, partial [Alphaproteobacteria bacterium]
EALTPAQREQLVDSFGRLTVATYANRLDAYTGEKFEVLEEVPQRQGMTLVKSQIIDSEGKPVALNYLMRETPQGWRVVDVFFKGSISELATRRSEYSSVIQRDGYEALNSRLAALAANETKPR